MNSRKFKVFPLSPFAESYHIGSKKSQAKAKSITEESSGKKVCVCAHSYLLNVFDSTSSVADEDEDDSGSEVEYTV